MNNTFLGIIEGSIQANWNRNALTDLEGKTYKYSDFATKIKELHLMFEAMGVQKGDRIAICGKNSSHWAIAFFATVSYGAVVVSVLHDFHSESIVDIANHSEAVGFMMEKSIAERVPHQQFQTVKNILLLDNFSPYLTENEDTASSLKNIPQVFAQKYPQGVSKDALHFHREESEELAMLNYTSGTTSNPKGVMLPYRTLWSNTQFAVDHLDFVEAGEGLLAMLPMAHMYGLAFEIFLGIAKGCHIHFLSKAPSPAVLLSAFQTVKPKLVISVPLIIEKIVNSKVLPELEKQPAKTLLKVPVLRNLVYRKVNKALCNVFGGNLKQVIIGGAALNKDVGDFLTRVGFPYTVGYGMTECAPLISYVPWQVYRPGCCGRIIERMQIKLDTPDTETGVGEILVKGVNVMQGYYKNAEATQAVFTEDGWLRTGDLASIDADGFIFIKGRNKSMILGASGQNIYPEEIEEKFNSHKYVLESIVVERNGKLVALIVPDGEALQRDGIEASTATFDEVLKAANGRLPGYCKVSAYELRSEEFEKTPKKSIRRFMYK